jgi:hypothetical protein
MRAMKGIVAATTAALLATSAGVVADDSTMFRKNVSNTPELETEFASIRMLPLYVPPQSSAGELVTVEYKDADGAPVLEDREYVQPLIVHYTDGHVEFIDEEGYGGFPGHGERDAYGAVSLDGGNTWKRTNLSRSGDLSSIKIKVGMGRGSWVDYPGDVGRTFMASDGNKVLVTWVSKYCGSGSPAYAISDDERGLLATHLEGTGTIASAEACTDDDPMTPCTYLEDAFGVAGSQGVQTDLDEDGYPLVGPYPYSCMWAARGVLIPTVDTSDATTGSTFVWFKAERLSSGVRSANRPETVCVKGAGCVATWAEDPEGIRPGEGEGPGEGWSGAVAHHQTDTWYSYIDWDDFDLPSGDGSYGSFYGEDLETSGAALADWLQANPTGSPKAAVPMSVPMRLTDNAMCTGDDLDATDFTSKAYCGIDFDGSGIADFCAVTVAVTTDTPEGPDQTIDMCVTEDGRLMRGNTASTRARLGLHGYSTDDTCVFDKTDPDACPIDSAWFYMSYEENKGLGDEDEESDDLIGKSDMGKNVWYHTFDMFKPELVSQGLMLNQPAVYPDDFSNPDGYLTQYEDLDYNFYQLDPDPVWETQTNGALDTTLLQSEISRRPSVISQDWYDAGPSGTVAFQLWKQGIIRRGGPADIMARRFVMATGDGTCTDKFEYCTTSYEYCTTTYEQVVITQDCHTEQQWVAYQPNPAYAPNTGICKRTPLPLRCYPYLDLDGNPTLNQGTYADVEVCVDVETWKLVASCNVSDTEHCRATTTCEIAEEPCAEEDPNCRATTECEPVDGCETTDPNCTVTQVCEGELDDNLNPYDYANMECVNPDGSSGWAFTDESNPRYVKGLCAAPAINLSSNTILESEACGEAETCLAAFPFNDYFDDMDMTDAEPISKIWYWQQYGAGYGEEPLDSWQLFDLNSLNDQSWENPYDMAKGHRGFMAGDMVMAMYGWTNNWKALTEGKDIVNLYVRRSFDGGVTWSTLPATFEHTNEITYSGDGTTTCEWYGETGTESEYAECLTYDPGEFEQARNVSQLLGNKVTVLDPRYSPTTRSITEAWVTTASLPAGFSWGECTGEDNEVCDDVRDPSRFFMVYETGYTSAYDAGEAEPLDLFYSRAVDWGDDYLVWQDEADTSACLPSAENTELAGFCNEFDAIEGSQFDESGEGSVTCSPGGTFFHTTWNQWDFDRDGNETGADAWYRRILFLDDYTVDPPTGGGSGD